jgi:hypothetical protein
VFLSLDFLYTPAADVDDAAAHWVDILGARLEWKVRAMGTTVACVRPVKAGPAILLADHVEGETPILMYRVADYGEALERLRAGGLTDIHEVEIPPGPCATFHTPAGQRVGLYELTRPDARFAGRIDP